MLRFAPRYGMVSPCLVRPGRGVRLRAANDNSGLGLGRARGKGPEHWAVQTGQDNDALLAAALRLFASHGLSAARHACDQADAAQRGGDFEKARWWIAVCHTLDRNMARAYRRREAR